MVEVDVTGASAALLDGFLCILVSPHPVAVL